MNKSLYDPVGEFIVPWLTNKADQRSFALTSKFWASAYRNYKLGRDAWAERLHQEFGVSLVSLETVESPQYMYSLLDQHRTPRPCVFGAPELFAAYLRNVDLNPGRDPFTVPWFYFPYNTEQHRQQFNSHCQFADQYVLSDYLEKGIRYRNHLLVNYLICNYGVMPLAEHLVSAIQSEDIDLIRLVLKANPCLTFTDCDFRTLFSTRNPEFVCDVLRNILTPELVQMFFVNAKFVNLDDLLYPGSAPVLHLIIVQMEINTVLNSAQIIEEFSDGIAISTAERDFLIRQNILAKTDLDQYEGAVIADDAIKNWLRDNHQEYWWYGMADDAVDMQDPSMQLVLLDDVDELKRLSWEEFEPEKQVTLAKTAVQCGSLKVLRYLVDVKQLPVQGQVSQFLSYQLFSELHNYHGHHVTQDIFEAFSLNLDRLDPLSDQCRDIMMYLSGACQSFYNYLCEKYPNVIVRVHSEDVHGHRYVFNRPVRNRFQSHPFQWNALHRAGYNRDLLEQMIEGLVQGQQDWPDSSEVSDEGFTLMFPLYVYTLMFKDEIDEGMWHKLCDIDVGLFGEPDECESVSDGSESYQGNQLDLVEARRTLAKIFRQQFSQTKHALIDYDVEGDEADESEEDLVPPTKTF